MLGKLYGPGAKTEWIEFMDAREGEEYRNHCIRINASFFLSNYNCTYGSGCKGTKYVDGKTDEAGACCVQGVTFVSQEDFDHVSAMVEELTDADCADLDHVRNKGWFISRPSGEQPPSKTRKLGGSCIFANPMPTKEGDPPMGCAFHHLAERTGRSHVDTKPETCWLVPITLDTRQVEDLQDTRYTILSAVSATSWAGHDGEYDPEPGDEIMEPYFDYWCTDTPDAYNGKEKFWVYSEREITKLIGPENYVRLGEVLAEYGDRKFPMPGELENDGKPMIANLISLKRSLVAKRAAGETVNIRDVNPYDS